eukprot:4661841-Pyramimonas_sp.AAC.1
MHSLQGLFKGIRRKVHSHTYDHRCRMCDRELLAEDREISPVMSASSLRRYPIPRRRLAKVRG